MGVQVAIAPVMLCFVPAVLLLLLFPASCADAQLLRSCGFDRIYQLGDSISDTGNLIRESPAGAASAFARLPYGQDFSQTPTGRCSNGKLIIDYIAMEAGLPLLNPYKKSEADFGNGVNFAVAGATALSVEILGTNNIVSPVTPSSLDVQLDWMFTHFDSLCSNDRDCVEKLNKSLFMVGEIGGNDYNYALLQGISIRQVQSLVPRVVETIMNAVRRVTEYGAVRVVVPGNFPIGCLPIYLTAFKSNESAAYDGNGCIKELNKLSKYHNSHLKRAIQKLNQQLPNATVVYGDYYNTFQWLFQNAPYLGFDEGSLKKACCGTGGDYDFDLEKMCGAPDVPVCADPERRLSWDGVHLTQEAYANMAQRLIRRIFPQLHCNV